jgi:hypothetical protein
MTDQEADRLANPMILESFHGFLGSAKYTILYDAAPVLERYVVRQLIDRASCISGVCCFAP